MGRPNSETILILKKIDPPQEDTMTGHELLEQIAVTLDVEDEEEVDVRDDGSLAQWFRAWQYYTDRAGEEDDDHPRFTGCELIKEIVERILDGTEFHLVSISDSEKRWFRVRISK
jgi:hypothetical protein